MNRRFSKIPLTLAKYSVRGMLAGARPRARSQNGVASGKAWIAGLTAGLGTGAGLVYLFDLDRGRARRAMLIDKAAHIEHKLEEAIVLGMRDLRNRTRGLLAEARAERDVGPISDERLLQHIRAEIGRLVSHPHSIQVEVKDGLVILRGPVLRIEHHDLVSTVRNMPGVHGLEDHLEQHGSGNGIPGLQGGTPRPRRRSALMQETWAPGPRLLAGLLGGALAAYGSLRRGFSGVATGILGMAVLARAAGNRPLKRLVGIDAGYRAVDFHKTLDVTAPLEEVYKLWSHFENFPLFMEHVREVTPLGEGESHWKVAGPAGVTVEWDAAVTAAVPNELFAWRTLPDQPIQHAGIVRFEPGPDGTTRLDIRMSYNPPGGTLGHTLAALLGTDPKAALDEDLLRFKSLLEQGKTTAHHQQVELTRVLFSNQETAQAATPAAETRPEHEEEEATQKPKLDLDRT